MFKRIILLITPLLLMALGVKAQVTTSSMTGVVTDDTNETLIGATVTVVHEPSGTTYNAVTNLNGQFALQGLRAGGPYKVTISYIGYQTKSYQDIALQLGESYNLDAQLSDASTQLNEVVVTAAKTKFTTEKTGASTSINARQIAEMPTIGRSITDIARISPYANGMGMAGGDGRSTNFTIDGANFNNNFGLDDQLPGGGSPISMDALEEMQVVVAPYDVRQTNFIGGGINAVTRSGTNQFKGSAYTYYYNDQMRGNRIDGVSLNVPKENDKSIYGVTLGGPIVKNKLFFFANAEYTRIPMTVNNWQASTNGVAQPSAFISAASAADMQRVSDFVKQRYGYNTGSYTNFPADESNLKLLGRIDWNINDAHRLAVRYNHTVNTAWSAPNGNSTDAGLRLYGKNRMSQYSMSFANSMYSTRNIVNSISADLNSRFSDKLSNQLLFTYSDINDKRGSDSSLFPFIDIMAGYSVDDAGVVTQQLDPYISLGYELFSFNNTVRNKVITLTDNATYYLGSHKLTAGFNFEHQLALNGYMRNGTGYYRYRSVDDFINGAAPEAFALTYGFNGNRTPSSEVTFNQYGLYAQDEWNINRNLKLTAGVRFDYLKYDDDKIMTNNAILAYDFGGRRIDTGIWPKANVQVSPRLGLVWDVRGDKTLKVRGGTGIFTGRLPLVFFANMPANSGMIQSLFKTVNTTYNSDGTVKSRNPLLDKLAGNFLTDVDEMKKLFNLPETITPEEGQFNGGSIAGVDRDFKMPQVWKSSLAIDYQLPVSFPLTVTGEFTYSKNINAVMIQNWNIRDNEASTWQRFEGPDNRLIYPASVADYTYYGVARDGMKRVTDASVLTNTSRGHGYTFNLTATAQPTDKLSLMASYTHTVQREVSSMPGNAALAAWQNVPSVDGPNSARLQNSGFVIPDRLIAQVNYTIEHRRPGFDTHLGLFYTGYSPAGYSYIYTNDMNGDGLTNDLIYIPRDKDELAFATEADRNDFWNYLEQDSYLSSHKGQYAEAYSARAPWVNRFDLRVAQDFALGTAGKHRLQVSLDLTNVGNIFSSTWGVEQTMADSNNGSILQYAGMQPGTQRPVYKMWRDKAGVAPTSSYSHTKDYTQCWQLQLGVRYTFN